MSPRTDLKKVGKEPYHLHVLVQDEEFRLELGGNGGGMGESEMKSVIIRTLFCECCVGDVKIEVYGGEGACNRVKVVDFQDKDGNWGIELKKGGERLGKV